MEEETFDELGLKEKVLLLLLKQPWNQSKKKKFQFLRQLCQQHILQMI